MPLNHITTLLSKFSLCCTCFGWEGEISKTRERACTNHASIGKGRYCDANGHAFYQLAKHTKKKAHAGSGTSRSQGPNQDSREVSKYLWEAFPPGKPPTTPAEARMPASEIITFKDPIWSHGSRPPLFNIDSRWGGARSCPVPSSMMAGQRGDRAQNVYSPPRPLR